MTTPIPIEVNQKLKQLYTKIHSTVKKTSYINKSTSVQLDPTPTLATHMLYSLLRVYMPHVNKNLQTIKTVGIRKYLIKPSFRKTIENLLTFHDILINFEIQAVSNGNNNSDNDDDSDNDDVVPIVKILSSFVKDHMLKIVIHVLTKTVANKEFERPKMDGMSFKPIPPNYQHMLKVFTGNPIANEFKKILDGNTMLMSTNEMEWSYKKMKKAKKEMTSNKTISDVKDPFNHLDDLLRRLFYSIMDTSDAIHVHLDYKFPRGFLYLMNKIKRKIYGDYVKSILISSEKTHSLSIKTYRFKNIIPIEIGNPEDVKRRINDLLILVGENWKSVADKIGTGSHATGDLNVMLRYVRIISSNRQKIKFYGGLVENLDKLVVDFVKKQLQLQWDTLSSSVEHDGDNRMYRIIGGGSGTTDTSTGRKFKSISINQEHLNMKIKLIKLLNL